ncbi:MAG: RNA ligase (ATP) [Planctomycetaceae bacterium]|nr:RNA ligase (ATP) [Planctomycetaceae bacterium]
MRKLATIRVVNDLKPIAGADLIELAIVDGWKCVVKKGDFAVGSPVIYCEIDSFLPIRDEFEFLRKSSYRKLESQEGFRLRTMKLRGQVSQGLLLNTTLLGRPFEVGEDVSAELGIIKYDPPLPTSLGGNVSGPFPAYISKTDEERVQNLANDYHTFFHKPFTVSEKIDGTSFTAFLNNGIFGVCGRNWELAESEQNSHWRVARMLNIQDRLASITRSYALQGELVGPGIQGNRYRLKTLELYLFNIFDIEHSSYVDKETFEQLCSQLDLKSVPKIGVFEVPKSTDEILSFAEGSSLINSNTDREGLVWVHGSGNSRISFKTISNRFLTKYDE